MGVVGSEIETSHSPPGADNGAAPRDGTQHAATRVGGTSGVPRVQQTGGPTQRYIRGISLPLRRYQPEVLITAI